MTVRLSEELAKAIGGLRRELILKTGREFSKAAVIRLLIFLGLKEAGKKPPEVLAAIAEREGLL